jgi:hypothetical protein
MNRCKIDRNFSENVFWKQKEKGGIPMKPWMGILTAGCVLSLCGCAATTEQRAEQEVKLEVQTEDAAVTTAPVDTDAGTETTGAEAAHSTQTTTADAAQKSRSGTGSEAASQQQEGSSSRTGTTTSSASSGANGSGNSADTTPAEGIYGAAGKTETEWMALAQDLYKEAMDLSYRYLCGGGSVFPFDAENLEVIDKTYFLTTCTSFDDATAPYYEVFSKAEHADDFDGILLEQDGRLYAARVARGMDISYLSSEVQALVSVSETEVRFTVCSEYEDGEVLTDLTLVPEDGTWKVGEFTLPY